MNMLMELRAEINDANSANRALKAEVERLEVENKELRKGQIIRLRHAKETAKRLKADMTRDAYGQEDPVEELRAEVERLKAGWETAFNIGVSEQEQNKKLRAEIERLKAALTDIASDICSRSGAVAIAKDALAGKTREEWS